MPSYRGYRFPSEVISHAVWLYHRFSLSFRDVEDLLAERGITVTYETIRHWCLTFGLEYARRLRRRRGRPGALVHESSRLRAPETSIVLMSRRNPADDYSEEDEVESPSHVQDEIPRQELGLLRSRPRPTRRRHGLVLGGRHRRLGVG